MRAVLILMIFAALPAHADVKSDMADAIYACLAANGNPNTTYGDLNAKGWEGDADDEMGVGFVYPPSGDNPTVSVALDGSYCNIESQTVGSEAASQILLPIIEETYDVEYNKSEDGCTQFGLGEGVSVTVLSGGNDPTCAADTSSALRFEYELQ